ncbi:hypothetical protein SAMN05421813_10314 [Daejeonella rubra]|uniref:Uncharacterized protein n=1 Tax=Daejeonella rubra TaxID=990371 RepID=A0A1G9NGM5_9SPHI|nr:hypothetical protein [Daejeonella rubra]SDL85227.1 hypothetical protein SAMN05421813_10314 [Daejeonella rubra]
MDEKQPVAKGNFGKLEAKKDPRDFDFSRYLLSDELEIPVSHDWTSIKKTAWETFGNDKINNCTFAAAGHMIVCWTSNSTTEHPLSAEKVISAYAEVSGFDEKKPGSDRGLPVLDALKYWRKVGIDNRKIKAFASVPHLKRDIVKSAIYLFGGLYAGLQLPSTIIGQKIWDTAPDQPLEKTEPGSYGGHAVTILAYDEEHLTCVTLGEEQKMTWDFWEYYSDEAFAIITEDFFNGTKTPIGLNMEALENDLLTLTKQKKALANQLDDDDNIQPQPFPQNDHTDQTINS